MGRPNKEGRPSQLSPDKTREDLQERQHSWLGTKYIPITPHQIGQNTVEVHYCCVAVILIGENTAGICTYIQLYKTLPFVDLHTTNEDVWINLSCTTEYNPTVTCSKGPFL